MLFKIWTGKVS